jgi:hypothetical protein
MSAQPAEVTELHQAPPPVRPVAAGQLRAERRAEKARERHARQRWAIFSVVLLAGSFGATVGILEVKR